jgi:hypothetical protein
MVEDLGMGKEKMKMKMKMAGESTQRSLFILYLQKQPHDTTQQPAEKGAQAQRPGS